MAVKLDLPAIQPFIVTGNENIFGTKMGRLAENVLVTMRTLQV